MRRVALTLDATPPATASAGSPVSRTVSSASASMVRSTTRCARNANCSFGYDHCTRRSTGRSRRDGTSIRSRPSCTRTSGSSGLSRSAIGEA